jgi:transcriptional antiterminator
MDIRIVKEINDYIITESTGVPNALANKLGVSERTVYKYISYMKMELNAPIIFDKHLGNYRYERVCELCFKG